MSTTLAGRCSARERHHNEGHGRRLTAAFEALDAFPVLLESRDRLRRLFVSAHPPTGEVIAAVEGDVALAINVLRMANQVEERDPQGVDSAALAIDLLPPGAVPAIAGHAPTFDFFELTNAWGGTLGRFRLHAIATQHAADRLSQETGYQAGGRLKMTALLHDIGKLVLAHAYPSYPDRVHGDARTPGDRLERERRELGVDHGVVGGVLARRWGLPHAIASVIERHHAADSDGEPAIVRLADMLAHYSLGASINPAELTSAADSVGVGPDALRAVLYDLTLPLSGGAGRRFDACPLSTREVDILRRLARGMLSKQIAGELWLSTSTIRTHLHNLYGKLGVTDRAHAVLLATERGWI